MLKQLPYIHERRTSKTIPMSILSIERTDDAVVIRLPLDASADYIQNMLNYVKYIQTGAPSKVTQQQIDELGKEGKNGWWEKNKGRFEGMALLDFSVSPQNS